MDLPEICGPYHCIYVTERKPCFDLEDCFALNCTLKFTCSSQQKKRTLRVKNCLYFDVRKVPRIDDKYVKFIQTSASIVFILQNLVFAKNKLIFSILYCSVN